MSAEKVVSAVAAAGLPVARVAWPEGSAPPLPWCVFLVDEDRGVAADDGRWCPVVRWRVELYSRQGDEEAAAALDSAIGAAFGAYVKQETWVESEACVLTSYEFTEIGE